MPQYLWLFRFGILPIWPFFYLQKVPSKNKKGIIMKRIEIIKIIGERYHTENIENGEWSYQKALGKPIKGHKFLDIRFEKNRVSILVETKPGFTKKDEKQLFDYINLEKEYKGKNNIIAILANTNNDDIKVWKNEEFLVNETKIKTIDEYINLFDTTKINDKEKVMKATYDLNKFLHGYIKEDLRSQFVGTCLLALKNNLVYQNLTTKQIISGIKEVLENLLVQDLERSIKIATIDKEILDAQEIKELKDNVFIQILNFIKEKIIPFINDKTNQGQDLLNLFFTTFNKYVGKKDKNQAFTPSHIVHFMCKIAKIDRNSVVLDPTCGSGAFLVQAMTQALENCRTKAEREHVKKYQIYGIEKEHKAYGLSVTNMLIHSDGNSNIKDKSCFERFKDGFIDGKGINVVLMNPPYNATIADVPESFFKTWKNQSDGDVTKQKKNTDPTKGFYFVYETAKIVKQGILLCLLPLSCAIGSDELIARYKKKMLEENTLNAVFTLPPDMFHPGATANACCMVFTLGKPHPKDYETFFGYYKDDGFVKKKNLGRVDVKNQWDEVEKEWIYLYENKIEKPGLSVKYNISVENHSEIYQKEWLAEAYMKTDYSSLKDKNFEDNIRHFFAYIIDSGVNDE